ncbi:hypothetical protein [Pseudarthrobacter sp. BIM B-2242]|uniref:hypothetical protein n=1 Tax=Pseudarthrobacter sp. BIM B-2242 TaxID=2772401 RepID=UPI00168AAB06|nr:hypothetical protein [Pseudarthrobacter sp. BIM B-2242]QOD06020.1 hypothetical protein IDT60_20870 [Pseudarthrobacter sp. BIM B-2242]
MTTEPRTWTGPATVVIPAELMADFEEWLDQQRLLLMGPARMSEDPEDLVWTVGPRRQDLLAHKAASLAAMVESTASLPDRGARLRAMGISEEKEREIRRRAAEQSRLAKAQEEQGRLARQRDEDYQGD